VTRRALSTLTALVMVGTLFLGAPAPSFAADPPIIYYIAQSGTAASTPGDGTSCAAPDYVELAAGDDHASISSALTPASNGDTIYLCAGTYDIGTTIDLADETITLQGAAAATTILDGGGDTQILTSSGAITVSDLTFQDGSSADDGGAIFATTATVSNSTFTGNTADFGGAISSTTATVTASTFTGNTADFFGGAIYAVVTATVSASTFRGNTAGFYGGAIFSTTNTVTSSTFTSNSAILGGAIRADTATVSNSTFTSNTSVRAGGAIQASTTATVSNSTFTSNTSVNQGGAISASTGAVVGSRFTRNTSGTHGGAIYFASPALTDLKLMRRNSFSRNTAAVGGAMTFGPCVTPSRSQAARVERANHFSGNRATEQRRTNNIERLEGGCV